MYGVALSSSAKVTVSVKGSAAAYYRAEAQAFRERHPSAPQISLPPPAARALKARGEGPWTKKSMNDAMNTFMMDFDIMCVFPELTHFEELYEDARWRVSGFADQVRMPCAECGTNEFVRLNRSTTSSRFRSSLRAPSYSC